MPWVYHVHVSTCMLHVRAKKLENMLNYAWYKPYENWVHFDSFRKFDLTLFLLSFYSGLSAIKLARFAFEGDDPYAGVENPNLASYIIQVLKTGAETAGISVRVLTCSTFTRHACYKSTPMAFRCIISFIRTRMWPTKDGHFRLQRNFLTAWCSWDGVLHQTAGAILAPVRHPNDLRASLLLWVTQWCH